MISSAVLTSDNLKLDFTNLCDFCGMAKFSWKIQRNSPKCQLEPLRVPARTVESARNRVGYLLMVAQFVEGEAFVRPGLGLQGGGDARGNPVFFDSDQHAGSLCVGRIRIRTCRGGTCGGVGDADVPAGLQLRQTGRVER